ncbi:hypothetical protein MPDQ_005008 [Monascus purpureus]|uniref:Phosphatidylglycerol/phosphatidylinositol transfer protein n=1 Tax=Monascus purpureus TaxID=5098 RepID=A0A507QZE5_MONPU|nr:hypothetical protein MPDQ_005008 [Monascus purpureus]BDD54460.1 hypothetical protein MAP00_000078 [Monascus purpureus]
MMLFPVLLGAATLLYSALCTAVAVTVNTTATELKAQGYTIDPLTIIGPVGPDGENITLTGTVQEIHSQLLEINSSYNVSVDVDSFTLDVATKHEKRCPDKILCGLTNYTPANPRPILEGAVYLEGFKGVLCHVEAGPKRCVRFSCSYNSAIWLCNDAPKELNIWCPDIGYDYVRPILGKCATTSINRFNGQRFNTDNFNVLVIGDKC